MTTADYKCDQCHRIVELSTDASGPRCDHDGCAGKLCRQWKPVAIGRVPGAGGSPGRGN